LQTNLLCVYVRAYIEFHRGPTDGSASRVLPAVYLALKLRFVRSLLSLFTRCGCLCLVDSFDWLAVSATIIKQQRS